MRALHAATAEDLRKEVCGLALLAEFDFPAGLQRVFAGSGGPLVWDNGVDRIDYHAAGDFVGLSPTRTGLTGRQVGHQFTISVPVLTQGGVSEADQNRILDGIYAEDWQGDPVRIFYAVFDDENQIIGDPILVAADLLDNLADTGGRAVEAMTVGTVPEGAERDSPVQRVYSPEDQRNEFPDDSGMDRQPQVGVQPIRIGAAPASGGGQSGSVSGESIAGAYRGR